MVTDIMLLSIEQTGVLNEQRLGVLVRVERVHLEAISKLEADFFYNRHLTFSSVLKIYTYTVFLSYRKKHAFVRDIQSGTCQSIVRL